MSVWTHVAGVIRIDSLRVSKIDIKEYFDKLIGKECLWEDKAEVWDDQEKHPELYMPMGGEGSLQKTIWVNPDVDCMAAYTVTIFGDLRGYNTPKKIEEWFKGICDKLGFLIRNAVITIECETGENIVYCYNNKAK